MNTIRSRALILVVVHQIHEEDRATRTIIEDDRFTRWLMALDQSKKYRDISR